MAKRLSSFQACMRKELKVSKARARKRTRKTSAQISFGAAARKCARLAKARKPRKKRTRR